MIKKRLKPILPTLKERKRYLAYNIISKKPISSFKHVEEQINAKSLEYLGQLGYAEAGISVLKSRFKPKLQKGIIRVNNNHTDNLKAALTFIRNINSKEAIVKSLGVSGMIKKAEERYLR
ncbi:hypothetical protein GF336_06840 [Candidatus Woesearchaeota archaeon]|nr:hypothetical protein [Candidatus Woesearchaeota archaeon]